MNEIFEKIYNDNNTDLNESSALFEKVYTEAEAEDTHSLFLDWLNANQDPDNMLPPPLDSGLAIKFLKDYLLGENWYVAYSAPASQINTEIVYSILKSYSKKFRKELKREEKKGREKWK